MGEHQNDHAQDGPAQIGVTLKNTRQELGLTHEDVERVTKIRTRYLDAMERDDYDSLPGSVYALGFLKTYANYLDLDGERLSREFKRQREEYEARAIKPPVDESSDESYEEAFRPRRDRSLAAGRSGRPRRRRVPVLTIVGAVIALLVLVITVAGLYFVGLRASQSQNDSSGGSPGVEETPSSGNNNSGESNDAASEGEAANSATSGTTENQQNISPQSQQAEAEATGEPEPAEQPLPAEPPPAESLNMEVRVDGNISWLNIEVDGNVVFVQVAEPGFVQTFEAEESITVWSGNAGAVFLSVNGQDYGQFGESGRTKIQEFTLKAAEN